jgi:hypothetical protein
MSQKRIAAAVQLRAKLQHNAGALAMYQGDAMYHMQIDYTCRLLDAVDEVTDSVTATLITDVIYERLTGDGVSAAAERIREAHAQIKRLSTEIRPLFG